MSDLARDAFIERFVSATWLITTQQDVATFAAKCVERAVLARDNAFLNAIAQLGVSTVGRISDPIPWTEALPCTKCGLVVNDTRKPGGK